MRILITEFMDDPAIAELRGRFQVIYDPALVDRRDEMLALLKDCTGLIVRNRTQVDAAALAAAPRLRVIGRLGVGLDNIDTEACAAREIKVIPATGANAQAVAEYVITMALVLLRGTYAMTADVAAGRWPRNALSEGREVADKTLGLVGFGSIGRRVASLAYAVGMRVIAHDPLIPASDRIWRDAGIERRELDDVLAESDVISLHIPLADSTRGLIGAAQLRRMKRGAVLVNTARGGIVDEAALAAALMEKHLGGAAIDVFVQEPLPAGSPLAGVPNLILTPHIAGLTAESNARVSRMIANRVAGALHT